jgi:hypothetical protein
MCASTADELKRAVPDKPSRDPKDHPARIPEEAEPHPTARLLLGARRLRVRVVRTARAS